VDDLDGAIKNLDCHTSMPAACAQICAKLKWAGMIERSESCEDQFSNSSSGSRWRGLCPAQVDGVFQRWMVSEKAAHATEAD
jgi:hypothetical protein